MPKRPRLTATQRRALAILADSGLNGTTTAGMLAAGFRLTTISRLVHRGLATARMERMKVGERRIQVLRVRITDVGRAALS
jgi:hypothetical protein